jgi:ATP-dependent Lhr-like helicase
VRAEGDVRGARTRLAPPLAPLPAERVPEDAGAALAAALRGWAPRTGPFTAAGLAARLALPEGAIAAALARLEAEGRVLRGRFLPGAPEAWCERGVLARVHRLTVGRLRQEIEPVSAATFLRFLARWQHLAPGTRLHGPRGLAEVVGQLQGFHAPAAAWERELLPARVAGYAPGDLDALCLSGEVAFGRLAVDGAEDEPPRRRSAPTRAAPVTLLLREDLPWLLDAVAGPPPALGPEARALVEVLAVRGASFAPELAAATGASAAEVEARLWELVSAGCVTCDAFAGLRGLVEPPPSRPSRAGFAGGRWSLLRAAPGGRAGDGEGEAALERLAQLYLRRWGVVLPGLLDRECAPPPWRDLVRVYRTLEARGAIRGGRFVAGFSGEQFALPGAVEALRATRRLEAQGADALEVAAADPLNVAGVLLPGPRVPATSRARAVLLGPAERRAVP